MIFVGGADTEADMAATAETLHPVFEQQLSQARQRQGRDLIGREAAGRVLMTCLFLGSALPLALLAHPHRHPAWWMYPAFGVGYALVPSIRIELGNGLALPTELVFVPMLFILPPGYVPLVVAAGLLAAGLVEVARG